MGLSLQGLPGRLFGRSIVTSSPSNSKSPTKQQFPTKFIVNPSIDNKKQSKHSLTNTAFLSDYCFSEVSRQLIMSSYC